LDGFNGTIFAYGQTSSGKTFTMQGVLDNPELEGITPRIIKAIYEHISNASEENQYIVKISLLEIYNEKIKVFKFISIFSY
jgi:kinesin family member 5